VLTVRPAILDRDVLVLDETRLAKASAVRGHATRESFRHCAIEKANDRHRPLLRAHGERPCGSCTAKQGNELAPSHRPVLPCSRAKGIAHLGTAALRDFNSPHVGLGS